MAEVVEQEPGSTRLQRIRKWFTALNLLSSYNKPILGLSVCTSEDAVQNCLKPKLLPNELEVARAGRVVLCPPIYSKNANEKTDQENADPDGLLVVTNFRMSFIASNESQNSNLIYQENVFLGKDDVTLSNIDHIYQIVENKKKLLVPGSKVSSRIDFLVIVCKNFRLLRFAFADSEHGKGKHIAEALLKFAFPNNHTLLFGYIYREVYYNTLRSTTMFDKRSDWTHELIRCGSPRNNNNREWRVLSIDTETQLPSHSLPLHYVVPNAMSDSDYLRDAEKFRDSRNAIWVFGYEAAALVRMADLLPDIGDALVENKMIETIRGCHPLKLAPRLVELAKELPSVPEIGEAYKKLRQLCTPDTAKLFSQQDDKFLKSLESSGWLLYVTQCLRVADEAARRMRVHGHSVILQENEGRDLCCIVSSLTQLILDPHARTISGFQSLVQKEWIALGHPFCDRMGHVAKGETAAATTTAAAAAAQLPPEVCPLFLLFLDCTWQLVHQFVEQFEFTETYLITVWDSVFIPIFDTFQFNCEHDRLKATRDGKERLILRPIWDWAEQFSDKDIQLFTNPLYRRRAHLEAASRKSMAVIPPSAVQLPITSVSVLRQHSQTVALGTARPMSTINITSKQKLQQQQPSANNVPVKTYLEPLCNIRVIEIWRQCYYRWLPIVEIQNGGSPQIELFHRLLLSNISKLQTVLQTQDFDEVPPRILSPVVGGGGGGGGADHRGVTPADIMPTVNSFFPFSRNNSSDPSRLADVLNVNSESQMDGSVSDTLSLTQIDGP